MLVIIRNPCLFFETGRDYFVLVDRWIYSSEEKHLY